MKFILVALILAVGLLAGVTLVKNKREVVTSKKEPTVSFGVKDFPAHGVSLIGPSDPSFAGMVAKHASAKSASRDDSGSVFLKNTGNRAIVGHRIKWECVDSSGDVSTGAVSNIVSWIFLHGEEADRRLALNRSDEIIKPGSTWLLSPGHPAQPLEDGGGEIPAESASDEGGMAGTLTQCVRVTVIVDGIFFDDGTFIGPDTTDFFTEVKSQMDARHEILRGVQNDLKAGKKAGEIFRGLEKIRDQEGVTLGDHPSPDELRTYFRNMFAQDVLGKKALFGADKALAEVQALLSRPWVTLRKL